MRIKIVMKGNQGEKIVDLEAKDEAEAIAKGWRMASYMEDEDITSITIKEKS